MLEKPDLPDEKLISCLRGDFGLSVAEIIFLPLGNDVNTAVYRVVADDGTPYFLKLRSGPFDESAVAIPRFLADRGIGAIIAPIPTRIGRLWARMDDFAVILSPFVAGCNGFEAALSDRQWVELGAALSAMHGAAVPLALRAGIPRETYSPHWRERAEQLGNALLERSLEYVLCHADIHGGNVLLGEDGALSIVDWDTLIFAPKERDLMFIGGGIGKGWNSAREAALFYQGYGPAAVDPMALVYYRYERIVEDIAAFCEQLLLTDEGGADREAGLGYLIGSFLPGDVLDIAYQSDTVPREM
jgi:spectinomycin phosphotransferase